MTRRKQVQDYLKRKDRKEIANELFDYGFCCGVSWADRNPHWISVEDKLPKENGRYLFYHEKIGVQDAYYYNDLTLDKAVTHWMPLPVPPVVSNSGNIGKKGGEK